MEETRLVQKLLAKLWSRFELLCGMSANEKNQDSMDKLGRQETQATITNPIIG